MNLKAANGGHSSGWEIQGPASAQRNIPKDDSVAYLLVSEDFEQEKSKEKREPMG